MTSMRLSEHSVIPKELWVLGLVPKSYPCLGVLDSSLSILNLVSKVLSLPWSSQKQPLDCSSVNICSGVFNISFACSSGVGLHNPQFCSSFLAS